METELEIQIRVLKEKLQVLYQAAAEFNASVIVSEAQLPNANSDSKKELEKVIKRDTEKRDNCNKGIAAMKDYLSRLEADQAKIKEGEENGTE